MAKRNSPQAPLSNPHQKRAGIPCQAFVDCIAIRADQQTTFQPDLAVNCGAPLSANAIEASNPVIAVEILSPSTRAIDMGIKVRRYFEIPSIQHYLILDADHRSVTHYARGEGGLIQMRIAREGTLHLEPPGFSVEVSLLFPEPYEA